MASNPKNSVEKAPEAIEKVTDATNRLTEATDLSVESSTRAKSVLGDLLDLYRGIVKSSRETSASLEQQDEIVETLGDTVKTANRNIEAFEKRQKNASKAVKEFASEFLNSAKKFLSASKDTSSAIENLEQKNNAYNSSVNNTRAIYEQLTESRISQMEHLRRLDEDNRDSIVKNQELLKQFNEIDENEGKKENGKINSRNVQEIQQTINNLQEEIISLKEKELEIERENLELKKEQEGIYTKFSEIGESEVESAAKAVSRQHEKINIQENTISLLERERELNEANGVEVNANK